MFHLSSSDCGAIGVNTKDTVLQVVELAQGKKRRVSITSLTHTWLESILAQSVVDNQVLAADKQPSLVEYRMTTEGKS
jgi:fibronectin type 3 domain-containing protein